MRRQNHARKIQRDPNLPKLGPRLIMTLEYLVGLLCGREYGSLVDRNQTNEDIEARITTCRKARTRPM